MTTEVELGTWVTFDDINIKYIVSTGDELVEFRFDDRSGFTLSLSERALDRCLEMFPVALARLRDEMAAADDAGQ